MLPKIARSLIFASLFILFGSFAWEYFNETPIAPGKMAIQFVQYFYQKYVKKEGEFSKLNQITDVFEKTKDFRILAALPTNGGPKYQTIYVYLGIVFIICIVLVTLPSSVTQTIGFFISISFTVAYALNLQEIRGIPLDKLQWPVYANFGASTLGLLLCIL